MSTRNELHIDSSHCRAICAEIGWRLGVTLARETPALPRHLQSLRDRLAEQELASLSIMPSMDDMVWPAKSAADPIGLARAA